MSSCTLCGEQAAWRCWSTVEMRTTGRPHVSPLPPLITSSPPPGTNPHYITSPPLRPSVYFCPLIPSLPSLIFSKPPHRLLTSLHLLVYPLLHPAHLYFHTSPVANHPYIGPVSLTPPPGPPAFHSHHHSSSSSVQTRG